MACFDLLAGIERTISWRDIDGSMYRSRRRFDWFDGDSNTTETVVGIACGLIVLAIIIEKMFSVL